ncbi:TPA: hypothetical protein N0F65_000536, partial [Lagenidium giganteum]
FVSFDPSMLRLSLWQGDVSFSDLQLRLPYGRGSIGQLSVKIPWRALWTQAVVIKAHDIQIFLHHTPKADAADGDADMDPDDAVAEAAASDADQGDDRTYLSRLVTNIISNVQVEITNLQVRYDCLETSTAKRPGSATLEVGHISLINANPQWELTYTPSANAGAESRKVCALGGREHASFLGHCCSLNRLLLSTEGISSYIEYRDSQLAAASDSSAVHRKYILHHWYSDVKATLSYNNSSSEFPDVDLYVQFGSRVTHEDAPCEMCGVYTDTVKDRIEQLIRRPRIHFGADHIDVLYAILIEVKAPYEEFDRLAELSQLQASRPEGFVTVLAYAKQWLLADCLDGIGSETVAIAADDDDDDDDEFADAITPPTLSIRVDLVEGMNLFFYSRDYDTEIQAEKKLLWVLSIGRILGSMKQSCVEDEIDVTVTSVIMFEIDAGDRHVSLFRYETNGSTAPLLSFSSTVPAYESRLVGYQPDLRLSAPHDVVVCVKDDTLVVWMTLFAPVYVWWKQWNASHPSKRVAHDEALIAPCSQMTVDVANFTVVFSVHRSLAFGCSLKNFAITTEQNEEQVVNHLRCAEGRVFSLNQDVECASLLSLTEVRHTIVLLRDVAFSQTSDSRTSWSIDSYKCQHDHHDNDSSVGHLQRLSSSMSLPEDVEERAMYTFSISLHTFEVDILVEEVEGLCWSVGKWSFFLPEADESYAIVNRDLYLPFGMKEARGICRSKFVVSIPTLNVRLLDRKTELQCTLDMTGFSYSNHSCTKRSVQRISAASVSLRDAEQVILDVRQDKLTIGEALVLSHHLKSEYAEPTVAVRKGKECVIMGFVGSSSNLSVYCGHLTGGLFPHTPQAALSWISLWHDHFQAGYLLSSAYGYDLASYRVHVAKMNKAEDSARLEVGANTSQLSVVIERGFEIKIFHSEELTNNECIAIGSLECNHAVLQMRSGKFTDTELKGTLRNLQLLDLTSPKTMPTDATMPNRHFICSNEHIFDNVSDLGSFGLKNVVDYVISWPHNRSKADGQVLSVRIRLDSVCMVYLHRVLKQFQHYVMDHLIPALSSPFTEMPSVDLLNAALTSYGMDAAQLPVSAQELLLIYGDELAKRRRADTEEANNSTTEIELLANDLTFVLPRSSFSSERIILHCTNARFWSIAVDPARSDFLQNGYLGDEGRMSHNNALSGATIAKAQQMKRAELRNIRRLVKNQRSRVLSNRSQLYVDLRNATQQAQNYLHEGFEALPDAEEAVRIIHGKIMTLDKQLEQLNQHLKDVEQAIDSAAAEAEALNQVSRDSFLSSLPSPAMKAFRVRSESMERIKEAHLIAPMFLADNAEFHDARGEDIVALGEDDTSGGIVPLFEFELVDLSGSTSSSTTPLFHHALMTGRIDVEPELLPDNTSSSLLSVNLALNELSVGANQTQYTILLGMIFENFKEMGSAVNEDTYPLCANCGGHHYDSDSCNAVWLKIPVKVVDAALRISNSSHAIADVFFEHLDLSFVLRTDDSLEILASTLAFTAVDVRPERCASTAEIIRPLPGDGLQVDFKQMATWTDTIYTLNVNHTNCAIILPALEEVVDFFAAPIFAPGEFYDYLVGFMPPPPPTWLCMEFHMMSNNCWFNLLEDFTKNNSRVLVVFANLLVTYSASQTDDGVPELTKWHVSVDQQGLYFAQLPDLQIDVSFPLSNPFNLVFDHFVEGAAHASKFTRRNSFVLDSVEARLSVQDCFLFINIINNYIKGSSPDDTAATSKKKRLSNAEAAAEAKFVSEYRVDKLLGSMGEIRFVLVNNSLGIPVADFQLAKNVCEYYKEEDYSLLLGGELCMNYFNNSIYRWEPLVEPFKIEMRVHRGLEENSRVEVFTNLFNTVNFNLTPAMAPLLSFEALKQADFVTTGSKSTAPFWIENKTGMEIKFSFRRGNGSVIQQMVADEAKVPVDCREQGDMRSFDSTLTDRIVRQSDQSTLTVNHTLSVWLNNSKWASANPVVVDVVGHLAVPLREVHSHGDLRHGGKGANATSQRAEPPILVADITIQSDGSKLISLHSQVVLQNQTSVPLLVWVFSPRDDGYVKEWVIDREQVCHLPIQLIHPLSKVSIRPSIEVDYAPLATTLAEWEDEVRSVKVCNTKRFVRSGDCVCKFETLSQDELEKTRERLGKEQLQVPLGGFLVRDLPRWRCAYDVEAYYLMRATFSSMDDAKALTAKELQPITEEESESEEQREHAIGEDGEEEDAEEDFRDLCNSIKEGKGPLVDKDFNSDEEDNEDEEEPKSASSSSKATAIAGKHPLNEINNELDEARSTKRRMYEATNSSLYHLSLSPFLTLHNRLATAVAYRLYDKMLQLVGEGVLAIGTVLPLFQVDNQSELLVSFRLENYNWSSPTVIVNPKNPLYTIPYKELVEPLELRGRVFGRGVPGEQDDVPDLHMQLKLTGREVILFCPVWIVNHSDLDLHYCATTSSSSKRLESVLKYVHTHANSDVEQTALFSTRTLSFHNTAVRSEELTRLQKKVSRISPVALVVVVKEARNLHNSQYFGKQRPYVRVSLYVVRSGGASDLFYTATTKPSATGGTEPKWENRQQNTLLLRLPDASVLDRCVLVFEVRNIRYGMDTCLGTMDIRMKSILADTTRIANFNWYPLMKRLSSSERKKRKTDQPSIHFGDLLVAVSVGSNQSLPSDYEIEDARHSWDASRSPSFYDDVRPSPRDSDFTHAVDDIDAFETTSQSFMPTSNAMRSLQHLQTPSGGTAPFFPPPLTMVTHDTTAVAPSRRARQGFALGDMDSSRGQIEALQLETSSTRTTRLVNAPNMSPPKLQVGPRTHIIDVFLPQNRFAFVSVEVSASNLLAEVFDLVCLKCGVNGILDREDFDFYELVLPRFVSLRSAGRPEGERWYGQRLEMDMKLGRIGRQHGLHLCHKMTMSTIRLYDEKSTASSHHVTPRALLTSSSNSNPAQKRPLAWGEVLLYGPGGKNWDVLRIKSHNSPWSDVIRLNRNAMGNSGFAQVITLSNDIVTEANSDLKTQQLEIALWSCFGTGRFSDTIIATILPRYILINRTGDIIKFRQAGVPHTYRLGANEVKPFHWPSAQRPKLMEVTMLHRYTWSGCFRINSLGTTYLKLRDSDEPWRIYILQCHIEMIGGSTVLVFREEMRRFPPYRIDNMTSFRIQYKQVNWGDDRDFDELPPRTSCPYSWDRLDSAGKSSSSSSDPMFGPSSSTVSKSLQVRFMRVTSSTGEKDSAKDVVENREYNLDQMATHRKIQLQRSLPSQLFIKPDKKGFLMKKDNLLKWNRKYFRLYDNMLYYFASEEDQELLGVIDLRVGSSEGGQGVAIFQTAPETANKGGFISLNGFVSSISGTIFGSSNNQDTAEASDDDFDDDDDRRETELAELAISLSLSTAIREKSEKYAEKLERIGSSMKWIQKGLFVNGHDLIEFLKDKLQASPEEAFSTAQDMLRASVLTMVNFSDVDPRKSPPNVRFQVSKIIWYSVSSIYLEGDDSESVDSGDEISQSGTLSTRSSMTSNRQRKGTGSAQFSIVTSAKCFELKADNPARARAWVHKLRSSVRSLKDINDGIDESKAALKQSKDSGTMEKSAKTYVYVRVRADGPTKVLELFEGGEEDFDDKDYKKNEYSSAVSVSSSPTASEASTNVFETLTNGISLVLRMEGFGISCVNQVPTELAYLYFGGISLDYSRVNTKMMLRFTLDDMQVDNQTNEATFCKLLCPRVHHMGQRSLPASTDRESSLDDRYDNTSLVGDNGDGVSTFWCEDCHYRQSNMAVMHFCCVWSHEQGETDYFEHCSFSLLPVIAQLDEELLVSARAFLSVILEYRSRLHSQSHNRDLHSKNVPIEIMHGALAEFKEITTNDELDPLRSLESYNTSSNTENRKVYFALLHIHPIECDITYRSDVLQASSTKATLREASNLVTLNSSKSHHGSEDPRRTASAPAGTMSLSVFKMDGSESGDESQSSSWAIPSLSMHIPDLDNAPVRLNALMIEHAFGTSGDLSRLVTKHYTRQLWKQLHKILGSFDFLGNPVGFLDHIGTGVRDFVYEPLEGLKVGGKAFSKGLAKGTASLVSNTLDGTFDAASKISGTVGQGLATMTLDDHYQQIRARARRQHVRGIREGLVQGSKELGLGVYEGVTGLVMGPMRGARDHGALGFVRGTVTGIIGLPMKPVAGIFDFASRASQGVRNRSLKHRKYMQRVRRPRVFGRYNELKCYKESDAIAYDLLKKTGGEKLASEKIIFYAEILQCVMGSELADEARVKRIANDSAKERTNSLRRSLQEEAKTAGEPDGNKLIYEVSFRERKLGLELETDFYGESVTVKAFDEKYRHHVSLKTQIRKDQEILQEGDCLIGIGGVNVEGMGFRETLALLRGTARPVVLQFRSADEHVDAADERSLASPQGDESPTPKLKVHLAHWVIVTEQRVLYINVGSFSKPIVEWMTPLRYIYRVDWIKASRVSLQMSVGVDSLPLGPRTFPTWKSLEGHEHDMEKFLNVMFRYFEPETAQKQELWPSDTRLNGYMLKKTGFTVTKRWFVLSRNCLYYFSSSKELRGIIPLGKVLLEVDTNTKFCMRITAKRDVEKDKPKRKKKKDDKRADFVETPKLTILVMDNGQVNIREHSEVVLIAPNVHEFQMWQSSIAHAAGEGLRHSKGSRFHTSTPATRLDIGCRETPDMVAAALAAALKKTVEVPRSTAPGAMAQTLEGWYYGMPPITRFYLTMCFLTTALSSLGFVTPRSFYLDFDLVWERFQIWRLTTCFMFLGKFSFNFLMQLMILHNYSSRLEEDPFPSGGGPTADFAFMLFLGACILWPIAFVMELPFLGHPLIFMIVYVWSRRNPTQPVSIWGFQFEGLYLPWALMGFTVLIGGSPVMDIFGVIAGHIYYFLLEVLPNTKGWNLIQTPNIFVSLFPTTQQYGTPIIGARPPAPGAQNAAGGGGGYAWGQGPVEMPNPRFPKIDIQELRDDFIKFELSETDASVANAVRRVMIAEVPTLAIDLVSIEYNSSVMTDEFLAHRLGFIPLYFDGGLENFRQRFVYSRDCDCDEHCPNCSVEFQLDVRATEGVMTVTSEALKSLDPYIRPVNFSSDEELNNTQDTGVIIAKLGPGQRIKLSAIAKLGIGKEHAKWSPVAVATYAYEPIITLNQAVLSTYSPEQKAELYKSCPAEVYETDENYDQLTVGDPMRCMYCDECVKVANSFKENPEDDSVVTIQANEEKFIFSVETTGQLRPEEVVICALDLIREKLSWLKHQCLELSQDDQAANNAAPITPFG